jgi:acyl-CoA synthetase (AMP-forming)/AMP-acid ligase II
MLTQRNMVSNLLQMDTTQMITWNGGSEGQGDTLIAVLPFYHAYGQCPSLVSLHPPLEHL